MEKKFIPIFFVTLIYLSTYYALSIFPIIAFFSPQANYLIVALFVLFVIGYFLYLWSPST
jgi:hypothetical protein